MTSWRTGVCTVSFLCLLSNPVCATNVSVYTENGLIKAENTLLVKIYADITDTGNGGPLVSAGFKLTYSPPLTNPVATKNAVDWYFGTPQDKHDYVDPKVTTDDEVVFLLGKLDQNSPLEGVSGQRILLGTVLFEYTGDAPTVANYSIEDGHSGNFVDFATINGLDLDSNITYSIGQITPNSALLLRDAITTLQVTAGITPSQPVRATNNGDINQDGKVGLGEAIDLIKQTGQ